MAPVTLYWRPMCGYCMTLKEAFEARDIPFESVNIWEHRDQADIVREANGGDELVPTVRVGDTFLANPSLEEVLTAIGS